MEVTAKPGDTISTEDPLPHPVISPSLPKK